MLPRNQSTEEPLWIYPNNDPQWKESIVKEFKIHPVTAQILVPPSSKPAMEGMK